MTTTLQILSVICEVIPGLNMTSLPLQFPDVIHGRVESFHFGDKYCRTGSCDDMSTHYGSSSMVEIPVVCLF